MASASLHTPAPTRKRKPDPARVVQSYYHEVAQRGRRGAYRRTGDLYNISDETVRRFVHAAEARANTPPLPDELAYVPPPFSDELAAIQAKSAAELATEGHPRDISITSTPQPAPQRTPAERGSITSSSRSIVAFAPQLDDATRHRVELGDRPTDDSESPQVPHEPGHARPDLDEPGAEAPELPPEAFPNPEPNQPEAAPGRDSSEMDPGADEVPLWAPGDKPTRDRHALPVMPREVVRVVRVPEQRELGGFVGWLATGPMLGPVPVWALLLLAFGALLVQLGLLG